MSVRAVLPVVAWLRSQGVELDALLAEAGVDTTTLFARDAYLSRRGALSLWQHAEKIAGESHPSLRILELLDLRLIDAMQFESGFVLLQLFAASEDVGAGLAQLIRFYPLAHGSSELRQTRGQLPDMGEPQIEVSLRLPPGEPTVRAFTEFSLGMVASLVRTTVSRPLALTRILFAHEGPSRSAEYARVFGGEVVFSADRTAFYLPESALHLPLRTRDPIRLPQIVANAEIVMAKKAAAITQSARVAAHLAATLRLGDLSIDNTARTLALSVRQLSRLLADEGTTHQRLLDETRATEAKRLLLEENRGLDDLPTALGYSDASAFRRAFRRWYGCSPSELRGRETTDPR